MPTFSPYDPLHYEFGNISDQFAIKDGAHLYRISSISHSGPADMLNGGGPLYSSANGRFHVAHQRTTYCANNVLVCISEILFHMYRATLNSLMKGDPLTHIHQNAHKSAFLNITRVREINGIVNIDTRQFRRSYGPTLSGTMTVHPDSEYQPFQQVSTELRNHDIRGIAYPSARHSRDFSFALFRDETPTMIPGTHATLRMALQLIPEDQNLGVLPPHCEADEQKIHPTLGYYQFDNRAAFEAVATTGALNPGPLAHRGYVNFVRQVYVAAYPSDAVAPC